MVPDVAAVAASYSAIGLPAHVNEPFEGFQNGGWRLDERYVEILAVHDPERFSRSPFGSAWGCVEQLANELLGVGGGAITFAIDVADVTATAARLRADGHQLIEAPVAFDHTPISFTEVFVTDGPRWAPFFITYDPPRSELIAQHPDVIQRGDFDLDAIVIETPDPQAAAAWLAAVIGTTPVDATVVPLAGGDVRFRAGDADAIVEVAVTGPTPLDETVAGLRYRTRS